MYDNPAQSRIRTRDLPQYKKLQTSWSVSLQNHPCRLNKLYFYINNKIRPRLRTEYESTNQSTCKLKYVKHCFATGGLDFQNKKNRLIETRYLINFQNIFILINYYIIFAAAGGCAITLLQSTAAQLRRSMGLEVGFYIASFC